MGSEMCIRDSSGAAGDMVLGALLDLGVPEKKVADAVSAFGLRMDVQEVVRGGIKAKRVKFVRNATEGERSGKKGISYGEIVRSLKESGLSESIVSSALNIFERIATAEARVHGVPKEKLHFHELGGLDTLGDWWDALSHLRRFRALREALLSEC